MAKAHVDPEDLLKFAKALAHYNRSVQELTGGIKGQMRRLEASWQDQEQAKFAQQFHEAVRFLDRFVETNEEHAKVLVKKAKHIEAYLDA